MSVSAEAKLQIKSEEEIYDLATPGPLNGRLLRQIFDCVFLPTLLSVQKCKAEEVEDFEKLKLLKDVSILLLVLYTQSLKFIDTTLVAQDQEEHCCSPP